MVQKSILQSWTFGQNVNYALLFDSLRWPFILVFGSKKEKKAKLS